MPERSVYQMNIHGAWKLLAVARGEVRAQAGEAQVEPRDSP